MPRTRETSGNSYTYTPNTDIIAVRVKDIILSKDHPEYRKFGSIESIGVIKYAPINVNTDADDTTILPAAYPLDQSSKTCPLINEVVFLIKGIRGSYKDGNVAYYLSPISLFNEINSNLSIDKLDNSNIGPGYSFKENPKKRPLYPFHGDLILQGRHGQSIRFTGANSFENYLVNDSNAGEPLTILTNGHKEISSRELYIEDINTDKSSIYLANNHLIQLNQARDKYSGAVERPVLAKNYKGNQIIVNSGRLYFNSTEEDINFSSKEKISLTGEQVSIDGASSIGLDAKKIYLGEDALRFETQPVLLGNQTELFLYELISTLKSLASIHISLTDASGTPIPALNTFGRVFEAQMKSLLNEINPNGASKLKSKKVFVE